MAIYDINGNELITGGSDSIYTSASMFQTVGVIGDSYASGAIFVDQNGELVPEDCYDLSWPQVLARICGFTAYNYSAGGMTTKIWLNPEGEYHRVRSIEMMNNTQANDLYIVALGINDCMNITLGSIADIESDSTDSFYSYYGRIIRAIRNHAPKAIIMLSTNADFGGALDTFSQAIKNIGRYYEFPVLDLSKSSFFQSSFYRNNKVSWHPIAITYAGMAKEYKALIENALVNNVTKYKEYKGQST